MLPILSRRVDTRRKERLGQARKDLLVPGKMTYGYQMCPEETRKIACMLRWKDSDWSTLLKMSKIIPGMVMNTQSIRLLIAILNVKGSTRGSSYGQITGLAKDTKGSLISIDGSAGHLKELRRMAIKEYAMIIRNMVDVHTDQNVFIVTLEKREPSGHVHHAPAPAPGSPQREAKGVALLGRGLVPPSEEGPLHGRDLGRVRVSQGKEDIIRQRNQNMPPETMIMMKITMETELMKNVKNMKNIIVKTMVKKKSGIRHGMSRKLQKKIPQERETRDNQHTKEKGGRSRGTPKVKEKVDRKEGAPRREAPVMPRV
jgi:hypothetical protein